MTDHRELFEVAYKWILVPPKRDIRALCANQSVPSSTKQRKKKKAQLLSNDAVTPVPSQTDLQIQEASGIPGIDTTNMLPSSLSISSPNQPPPQATGWSVHNPGLAQYHQYVWQVQQQPHSSNNEDAFKAIMQRLQATPIQPKPEPKPAPPPSFVNTSPGIVLPPPQFNLGQPPVTLLPVTKQEIPLAPKPTGSRYSPDLQRHPPLLQPQPPYSNSVGGQLNQTETGQHQRWPYSWQDQFYRTPSSRVNPESIPQSPSTIPYPPTPSTWVNPQQPAMSPYHPPTHGFDAANPLYRG